MKKTVLQDALRKICEKRLIAPSCRGCVHNNATCKEGFNCYMAAADTILDALGALGLEIRKKDEVRLPSIQTRLSNDAKYAYYSETESMTSDELDMKIFAAWVERASENAKSKFEKKQQEGYTGWMSPSLWDVFIEGIKDNLEQAEDMRTCSTAQRYDALLDILNFTVMAWRITYMSLRKELKKKEEL